MNCLFCQQEMQVVREQWNYYIYPDGGHGYQCQECRAYFTADLLHDQQEAISYYRIEVGEFRVECYTSFNGSCHIYHKTENRTTHLLRFPFIPPNLDPKTLHSRIKTWILFS